MKHPLGMWMLDNAELFRYAGELRCMREEAERILLEITGLPQAEEFQRLTRAEQLRLSGLLVENDLSIQQIARLTGTSKSRLARDLKHR